MLKLYKYRPLSELLFKELNYSELYFSSYHELNDPLDLSTRLNFKPENIDQLKYLLHFLIKNSIKFSFLDGSETEKKYIQEIIKLAKDEETKTKICDYMFESLKNLDLEFIPQDIIELKIREVSEVFQVKFQLQFFRNEIQRLTKVFFESSYVSCFSETCNDFLMWSHYASKHTGVCLEFSIKHKNKFPYILFSERKTDQVKFLEKHSEWEIEGISYWDEIFKVEYRDTPPTISFYDFSPVFENENDCDLMGLSKSYWHGYANELRRSFSIKTLPWHYEEEWRAIEISFGDIKEPEERIRHYPIEALTAVYFGIRTPDLVKVRINKILKLKNEDIQFFDCHLSDSRSLKFTEWQYFDEQ